MNYELRLEEGSLSERQQSTILKVRFVIHNS